MALTLAAPLALAAACGSSSLPASDAGLDARPPDTYDDPVAVQARLAATLDDLAALGWKRTGTPEGAAAGEYVKARFESAGLEDVRFESFAFPSFERDSSSLDLAANGAPIALAAHDVFAYSGAGRVEAAVVTVGRGHEQDYAGVDVTGKIVLVERDPYFHRSSQYRLIVAHGGAAMLYVSESPDNLIQIGTVSDPGWGLGPIPAVTVGRIDGDAILAAIASGQQVTAIVDVQARAPSATGRNVVGRLRGTGDGSYLLVGAHYDTWQIGSADNSTGVAALVEVAEALASRAPRRHDLVFVAYDGEEQGLFGGYDWLRDHVVVAGEPMLAFVNFEMPAADEQGIRALARTNGGPIHDALIATQTDYLYHLYVGMEVVPSIFGGIIPTDIQGMYWSGLQGLSTATDTPYYHTIEDTPEKIDTAFLADAVIHMEAALDLLDRAATTSFDAHDPEVWQIDLVTTTLGGELAVDVVALDGAGAAAPGAIVEIWVDVDDFTHAWYERIVADGVGRASATVPASALGAGSGSRWLHVTAGESYPLAERIAPL